jgi:hypothetical protein
MKSTHAILMVACMALLLIAGCRKPNNNRTTDINTGPISTGGQPATFPGGSQTSLNQLFKDLRYTPEVKCVTAGILQVVTFSKGTRLTFYPNSFKNAAGATITSGTVCIEMIEMYKPGDMISNMATTTTSTDLLRSGGQVHINATKDGQKVYANKYGIAFKQPAPSTLPMELFYGNTNNKDSVVTWGFTGGGLPGTTAAGTTLDTVTFISYNIFDSCTNFNFINCDVLADRGPRAQINIVLADTIYKNLRTRVFIVLPSVNAVATPCRYVPATNTFELGGADVWHGVPVGMPISIIVMSKIEDKFYYFEQTGLPAVDGMTVTANLTNQSLDYIKAKLAGL